MLSNKQLARVATSGCLLACLLCLAFCAEPPTSGQLNSPSYSVISDDDQAAMRAIKVHIDRDFSDLKNINDAHTLLDKVKLLVQKHPKNIAFARGDLKELHLFLSQEIVTKLIRVDTDPFLLPLIGDDKMQLAQRACDEDELTRKLFEGPLRSLIELRKQQVSRSDDGNHKEGNFFANFWCKIAGNCHN